LSVSSAAAGWGQHAAARITTAMNALKRAQKPGTAFIRSSFA
jgi:hypothetical protein